MSRHMFTPTPEAALEKEEYYAFVLERQAGTLPPLPWSKCAAFSIWKRLESKYHLFAPRETLCAQIICCLTS